MLVGISSFLVFDRNVIFAILLVFGLKVFCPAGAFSRIPPKIEMIPDDGKFDRRILLLLIGLEALLFGNVYSREVAWYPPGYFDQPVYLLQAYHLQQQILTHCLVRLCQSIWTSANQHGVTL